ncbi:hypothetical protein M426DRAFT_99521 [Hypoxylon sp. CI-4A]|nr:hypothetical protein M426DRAFT_99521 [Hypoxylon sp. CI-4A]
MGARIAQVSCWIDENLPEDSELPGFHADKSRIEKPNYHNSDPYLDFPLFPGRSITVGRDHHENNISINHPYVSRKHFVIYSILYELDGNETQPPLIYVRDCQSTEGTYIDETCIGSKAAGPSPGFYLSRDVVITIKPYWKFRVSLLGRPELQSPLTAIQFKESNLFKDRYIITNRVLGRGAYASVHLAINVKTGKQVACKIHSFDRLCGFEHPKELVRRTLNETDILGKLRHPNLPMFEYAFRSNHTLYAFTELATGGDLFSMRQDRGAFSEANCQFIIRQIINALRYLHKGGIAHRDIKPENVFFATGPDITSRVIVGDLGLAKSTALGRMASQVGTGYYKAPEIVYGQAHSPAVDIWSLGMLTVFLLAPDNNVVPSDDTEMNQAAINEWVDSVFEDSSCQEISEYCRDFVGSCLQFDPGRRVDASKAKSHCWFQQQPNRELSKFLKNNRHTWKPSSIIPPPVQELPDLGPNTSGDRSKDHVSSSRLLASPPELPKRKTPVPSDSEDSPYFTAASPPASKRVKIPEMRSRSLSSVLQVNVIPTTPTPRDPTERSLSVSSSAESDGVPNPM